MHNRKKAAGAFLCVLGIILLFIIVGTETVTITYHVDSQQSYSETHFLTLFDKVNDVKLSVPEIDNENLVFDGWYYDEGLESKAPTEIALEESLDVYAGLIEDNPGTEFLLPEIHITADTDLESLDRYKYTNCTYSITNTKVNDCYDEIAGRVRGRGNSTWQYFEKKPFRIKFEEKTDLFGMGEDKDWVLLSNSVDYTLMRNEIAMKLGEILGLAYTPECEWVQVFYNGEYQGIYLLCEQIETGKNRVDIEIPYGSEDIDISFLLELGGELDGFTVEQAEGSKYNWDDYFKCEIVYPERELVSKHQEEYIYAYMQMVNQAILTGNWQDMIGLVDIESFVSWYLVNEILLNGDMGWSMFAYKPQGDKLYLGPIWDFDQSAGSSVSGGADYETWYPDTGSQNAWFNTLIEMDEFRSLLSEKWTESLPEIRKLLEEEKEKAAYYQKDIEANYEKWQVLGTATWRIRPEIAEMKTYEENVDFLFEWLENRINWLNMELGQKN